MLAQTDSVRQLENELQQAQASAAKGLEAVSELSSARATIAALQVCPWKTDAPMKSIIAQIVIVIGLYHRRPVWHGKANLPCFFPPASETGMCFDKVLNDHNTVQDS